MSGGEARAIQKVEHEACGQTTYDQTILDNVVEASVVAGHPRPLPRACPYEPVDVFARPVAGAVTPVPAVVPLPEARPAPPKKGFVKRLREKVRL